MVSYSNDHLHVCEGRCIRCLSTTDEHLNDDNPNEGDQITCGDCGRAFLQQFCYRVRKQCELNGPYANYCDFLASLSNCNECRDNFSLSIKCPHFGTKRRRFRDKRVFFQTTCHHYHQGPASTSSVDIVQTFTYGVCQILTIVFYEGLIRFLVMKKGPI